MEVRWFLFLVDCPEISDYDPPMAEQARKTLEEVSKMRGMGTELVSVIIPPEKMLSDVRHHLIQEGGQAANIKSKSTRKASQGQQVQIQQSNTVCCG